MNADKLVAMCCVWLSMYESPTAEQISDTVHRLARAFGVRAQCVIEEALARVAAAQLGRGGVS